MTRNLGSTIVQVGDRLQLRYGSASSIRTAAGCLRRWHWEKISKKATPQTKSQILGSQVHAEIESYLQHGSLPLGPIAMAGLTAGIIPNPDSDLLVEHPIALELDGKLWAQVTIDDLPIVGFIDLVDRSDSDMWRVIDHKTLSDKRYAKTATDLLEDLQMLVYASAIGNEFGQSVVKLEHHNYLTRGTPRAWKVTAQVATDYARDLVTEIATPTIRQIRSVLPVVNSNDVPANLDQCGAYGGCPHREYCNGYTQKQLQSLGFTEEETNNMGRFVTPEMKAEMNVLKQGEKRNDGPIVKAYMDAIQKKSNCVPPLMGALAIAYTTELGAPSDATEGTGFLAKVDPAVETLDDLKILASELEVGPVTIPAQERVSPPARPIAVLPPDAPASKPEQADVPPIKRGRGRPRKDPNIQADTIVEDSERLKETTPSQLLGTARVIRSAEESPYFHIKVTPAQQIPETRQVMRSSEESSVVIYIDCMPTHAVTITNLASYCEKLLTILCERAGVEDPRVAPKDSPLAYGAWKGLLGSLVKMSPPTPGYYFIDTRGNEFHEVIASALAPRADLCVRGIR